MFKSSQPLKRVLPLKPRHAVLFSLLVLAAVYVYLPEKKNQDRRSDFLSSIPATLGQWELAKEHQMTQAEMSSLGAAEYVLRTYQKGQDTILLYAAFFTGKHGSLTHNPEKCYPGTGFTIIEKEIVSCGSSEQGPDFEAIRIMPVRNQDRLSVLYWFQEGDTVIINKWKHIAVVLVKAMFHNRTDSLMVRLSTDLPAEAEPEETDRLLREFAGQVRQALSQQIPQTS